MSNIKGIYVKFWLVLPRPLTNYGFFASPKLQISSSFNFDLILHSNLKKVTKFSVEKFTNSKAKNLKGNGGGGGTYPHAFMVKEFTFLCRLTVFISNLEGVRQLESVWKCYS